MDLLYRLLGIAARLNERGSRFRVNFVPSNLAIMAILVITCLGAGATALEGWHNGTSPRQARIADVLAHRDTEHNYVTVAGHFIPEARVTATNRKTGKVSRTWVPLLDAAGKRGLLVEVDGDSAPAGKAGVVEITGMLRAMDSDLRREIESAGSGKGPKFDVEYVLEQGKRPGDPLLWGLLSLLAGVLFALALFTWCLRYVVFRRTPEVKLDGPALPEAEAIDLRVTGSFFLDGHQHRQRFLNVPAASAILESGERVFVSNIDASSRLYGVTTQERKGYWLLGFKPGTLKSSEPGVLYIGWEARPALRIAYEDFQTGAPASAVLSFASEAERAEVYRDLAATT